MTTKPDPEPRLPRRVGLWRPALVSLLALSIACPPLPVRAAEEPETPPPQSPAPPAEPLPAQPQQQQPSRGIVIPSGGEKNQAVDNEPFIVNTVEAAIERDAPEICVVFAKIPDPEQALEPLIDLRQDGGQSVPFKVTRRGRALCLVGVEHGRSYRLRISGDLRAVNGRTLGEALERKVDVAERKPALAFRDAGFLITRPGEGLALRSVNIGAAQLRVVRLAADSALERAYFEAGDPALLERLAGGKDGNKEGAGLQEVWSGLIALDTARNKPVTTGVPITAIVGKMEPGVYAVQATAAQVNPGDTPPLKTAQWLVVSDLGLNTVIGPDGVLLFARTLEDSRPADGVTVRVIGRDRSELAQGLTGADGLARIDAAQLAGSGERTPQVLVGRRGANVAVVELSGPRAVGGGDPDDNPFQRPRLDAFIAADRAVYVPGDTLNAAVLLRDDDGRGETGEALAVEVRRPDGGLADRLELQDAGGGGYVFSYRLSTAAQPGAWRFVVRSGATDDAIGETVIRVDDTRPLGLALEMNATLERQDDNKAATVQLRLKAVGKAGRPAAGLSGAVFVTPSPAENPYPQFPDYRFGPVEKGATGERVEIGRFITGADGTVDLRLSLPDRLPLHGAFDARVEAEIAVAGSRTAQVERVVPYRPAPLAVGIKPRFEGRSVPDGATAAFDVVAVDGVTGRPVSVSGLSYELLEEDASFVWYDAQNRWDYRRVTDERRVAGGQLNVGDGAGRIAEPVGAGHYRLEVRDPVSGAASVVHFSAGWWMSPQAGARPDRVDIVAMRPGADGKAWIFLRPPYASEVLLVVTDKHTRLAKTQQVGADGAFIEVPTDADWTNGIHILATAFALPDPAYRGPPRRAVGTAWLNNGEQPRTLTVTVQPGVVSVKSGDGAASGERQAVLPVSVNLRGAKRSGGATGVDGVAEAVVPPWSGSGHVMLALFPTAAESQPLGDPAHYFFGERPLPISVRDAQGGLIAGLGGHQPPSMPNRPLVPHSGALWLSPPVAVDGDGQASFDVPLSAALIRKAARYRVVALGWNGEAIGRGEQVAVVPAVAGDTAEAAAEVKVSAGAPLWLRRGWNGVLPPSGQAVSPGPVGGTQWLLADPAVAPDFNPADAAARALNALVPVGTEAAASRLLALLALAPADPESMDLRRRVLDELLALQRPDGAFAAWDPAGLPDPWLTAFAVDTLVRAGKTAGNTLNVPVVTVQAGLTWLGKWWDGSWADPANLPAAAYALALLTDAKRLDAGAVGFFNEMFAAQLPSEHARALLAAAQEAVGDRRGADQTMARVAGGRRVEATTRDYGSAVRDAAAALVVMAEHGGGAELLKSMAARLQRTRATAYTLTDQEAAWLLLSGRAMWGGNNVNGGGAMPSLNVSTLADDATAADTALLTVTAGRLSVLRWPVLDLGTVVLRNGGNQPLRVDLLKERDGEAGEEGPRLTLGLAEITGSAAFGDDKGLPGELVAGDAVALTVVANFAPADRPRTLMISVPLPEAARPLTALALLDDVAVQAVAGPVEILRSRRGNGGVTAALRIPAGQAGLRLSSLLRVERAGRIDIPSAKMEMSSNSGRSGAVFSPALSMVVEPVRKAASEKP